MPAALAKRLRDRRAERDRAGAKPAAIVERKYRARTFDGARASLSEARRAAHEKAGPRPRCMPGAARARKPIAYLSRHVRNDNRDMARITRRIASS